MYVWMYEQYEIQEKWKLELKNERRKMIIAKYQMDEKWNVWMMK